MELVEAKKCVMSRSRKRLEIGDYRAINKVLETWSAMGFVVYTSKFHFDIVSTISNAF